MQKLLDLQLHDEPLPLKTLLEDCKITLKHQVKTGHPHFFNQLSCGLDIISLAGEWLTAAANTNMFTYEIAPVFILMENVVLEKMRSMIGRPGAAVCCSQRSIATRASPASRGMFFASGMLSALGILLSCNAMSAEYLFMTDKIYDPRFDTGDKRLMDRLMELSEYMVRRIREQPDRFYLIMEPELVNVSFWYLPRQLRGVCQVEG
ncbi:hypothetical protein MSG28_014932 [Choristoneura fumiferana]|uniref:Uncharacterized protein n=1 Tax=Choristoneura fumiferana TaxID=7141 RepID=A0ACC0KYA5_CHOFU|nr:hypothetical protein MSG28_014932 [Choristoneura fumiferana]